MDENRTNGVAMAVLFHLCVLGIFSVPCVSLLIRMTLEDGPVAALQMVKSGMITWVVYAWLLIWGDWINLVLPLVMWVGCIHGAVFLWQKQ